MSHYYKLLKDPRWKKKRKAILKRDGYKCTVCGSPYKLVVHHTFYYTAFTEPWKYPDKSLLTLCNECHEKYHREHEIEMRKDRKIRNTKMTRWRK